MNSVPRSIWVRAAQLSLAIAICTALFVYGYTAHGYQLLQKYPPDWSLFGSLKAIGLLVASILMFFAFRPVDSQLRETRWGALPTGGVLIGLLLLAASAVAIIFWPTMIAGQVREGETLSVLTEVAFVAALFLMALAALGARSSGHDSFLGLRPVWLLAGMMLVMFLILMEEMSWGQHWLGFSTPDLFEENVQNETNMHNFYTNRFEAAYYSAAVLVFVVLPFAWPREVPKFVASLSVFIPPPAFAILALPLCGIFFETWNYVMNQVWFYLGLLIAVHLYRREVSTAARRNIVLMGSMLVLSQIVFLQLGHNLRDGHELTEIRELAISLAFAAYSAILFARFRRESHYPAEFAHSD